MHMQCNTLNLFNTHRIETFNLNACYTLNVLAEHIGALQSELENAKLEDIEPNSETLSQH